MLQYTRYTAKNVPGSLGFLTRHDTTGIAPNKNAPAKAKAVRLELDITLLLRASLPSTAGIKHELVFGIWH